MSLRFGYFFIFISFQQRTSNNLLRAVKVASSLAKSINKDAVMEEVEYGRVTPRQILRQLVPDSKNEEGGEDSHAHSHDHDAVACKDPGCTDTGHSHSHDHDASASCKDPDCNDPSHSHDHDHDHDEACNDPDCTDTSHSHSHSHATSTDSLGIVNFVYKANKPFNTRKLMTVLNKWPVPIKDELDLSLLEEAQRDGYEVEENIGENSPFIGVLRSKGFAWFAPTRWSGPNDDVWRHDTAMFWSHAGKHFGISSSGKWWGTISKEQMKKYFKEDLTEYNRILSEDFVSDEFGDRRQEIVFIGINVDEEEITRTLDDCLLTEKGMDRYRQELRNYMNTILTSPESGPGGLFDVGGMEHLDV